MAAPQGAAIFVPLPGGGCDLAGSPGAVCICGISLNLNTVGGNKRCSLRS
jgi:hypothetical protein